MLYLQNDGIKLDVELATPQWATVSAVQNTQRLLLASNHLCANSPLIQQLRYLVYKIFEKVKDLDKK